MRREKLDVLIEMLQEAGEIGWLNDRHFLGIAAFALVRKEQSPIRISRTHWQTARKSTKS